MKTRSRSLPAGWYPDSAQDCKSEIEGFISEASDSAIDGKSSLGGIIPHAGWFFSGKLAAQVMNHVAQGDSPDTVVVFGGHLSQGPGTIYLDDAWETPLGLLEMDMEMGQELRSQARPGVEGGPTNDNTIEVHLPLVKYFFPDSKLVAVRAPHSPIAESLAKNLVDIAKDQGKSIKFFGSTDLTHYGPNYGFMPQGQGPEAVAWVKESNDKAFIDMALNMDTRGLLNHALKNKSACSAGAAAAVIAACRLSGANQGSLIKYYTSADIHPGDSFVGYAGIVY